MGEEEGSVAMDWQSLLWIGGLVVLFFVMMRGCGGMAGGCGMGSRRRESNEEAEGKQPARGDAGKAA
jgi:hypothetical protein